MIFSNEASEKQVRLGMAFNDQCLIAFDHNPFLLEDWMWRYYDIPVIYMGPEVMIPAKCPAEVLYHNTYVSPLLPDLTALIINNRRESSTFRIDECEWPQNKNPKIMVTNTTTREIYIKHGTVLGRAVFMIIPKSLISQTILKRLIPKDQVLKLPGGIAVEAKKLTRLYDLDCFSALNLKVERLVMSEVRPRSSTFTCPPK